MPESRFEALCHDDLNTVTGVWSDLERSGFVTPFQSLQWIEVLLRTLAGHPNARFFVVEVRDRHSQSPLMLLPMCLVQHRGYRVVEFASFDVCDLSMPVLAGNDALVDPKDAEYLWQAVASVLPPADLIEITQIPKQYRGRVNPLACVPGTVPASVSRYEASIEGDPAKIVEGLANSQTRRILKTSNRRLSERGTVRFAVAETREDLDQLFPVMLAQRQERFLELGRYDLLTRSDIQTFYDSAVRSSLSTDGLARMWALFVNDEPIATCLGLVHKQSFTLLIITMAGGSWASCSPGIALLSRIIQWSAEQGLTRIDFSVSDASYKTGLGGRPEEMLELKLPVTTVGRTVHAVGRSLDDLKARLKAHPVLFAFARKLVRSTRRIARRIGTLRLQHKGPTHVIWFNMLMPFCL
jgi:CelD/BcsL family acetyltransferase involved in cellulose biosynthesis